MPSADEDGVSLPKKVRTSPTPRPAYLSSDCWLIVGDVKLPTQKVLLSTQSRYFSRRIKESKATYCEIDMSSYSLEVVTAMLSWMHKRKVGNLDQVCKDLISLADLCNLDSLKDACAAAMAKQLTTANLFEMFTVADVRKCEGLKNDCGKFFCNNMAEVFATDGWKQMSSANPHVGLFEVAAARMLPHYQDSDDLTSDSD